MFRDLNNQGVFYLNQGKYREAEPLLQRALAVYEQQLGPEHPATAAALDHLNSLYYNEAAEQDTIQTIQQATQQAAQYATQKAQAQIVQQVQAETAQWIAQQAPADSSSGGIIPTIEEVHQIQAWINVSRFFRDTRRYLENHLELLNPTTFAILDMVIAGQGGNFKAEEELRNLQRIVQDARRHGGNITPVREAYVDAFGGFMLDTPSWLDAEIDAINQILAENPNLDKTAQNRAARWHVALKRARDEGLAPEIIAGIYTNIRDALKDVRGPDRPEALEEAIALHDQLFQIYTEARYPRKWAESQEYLGTLYHVRIQGDKAENHERAIEHFTKAQEVLTEDRLSLEWASSQINLGTTYMDRIQGEKTLNQEQAIVCFTNALRVYTEDRMPLEWAAVQLSLGATYAHRIQGETVQNREQALAPDRSSEASSGGNLGVRSVAFSAITG